MLRNTFVGSSRSGRWRIGEGSIIRTLKIPMFHRILVRLMQSKRVKGTGHVVNTEEKTSWGSLKERAVLENLGIDRKIPYSTG